MEEAGELEAEKHVRYILGVGQKKDDLESTLTEHLRINGSYWGLTTLDLLHQLGAADRDEIVSWIMECQHDCGGFGGNVGHDPHVLHTLSAVQVLALLDKLDVLDADKPMCLTCHKNLIGEVLKHNLFNAKLTSPLDCMSHAIVLNLCESHIFLVLPNLFSEDIVGLQNEDGSFSGDEWGEVDTRFSYCAICCLSILHRLDRIDVEKAVNYIVSCKNLDGGFGCVPGAESHAGQIFCCVGALAITGYLNHIDKDLLGWWLCERQVKSGGLNGRPEKLPDVCYSWWVLSSLIIIDRVQWIDKNKLARFILDCQDKENGGISDRPEDAVDVFHTYFGVAGLSLLEYPGVKPIDPAYALPVDTVNRIIIGRQKSSA